MNCYFLNSKNYSKSVVSLGFAIPVARNMTAYARETITHPSPVVNTTAYIFSEYAPVFIFIIIS